MIKTFYFAMTVETKESMPDGTVPAEFPPPGEMASSLEDRLGDITKHGDEYTWRVRSFDPML